MKLKLLFLLFFTINLLSGQVEFVAKVSKKTLGINERLQIDFSMNEDGDNFTPPSFENFKVIGGPSQSISTSWINGKSTYSKTYTYFLAPEKRGKINVGQASIEVKGVIYKTSPVEINVTAAVDVPKDPNDPKYIAKESIHLIAEISKSNPYLNEAVSVVYKLYVSENIGVSGWEETSKPSYNDFWSQNIDVKGLEVKKGKFKGENYNYVVLKKTLLYPQKTGKLLIKPLTLKVNVDVPSKRRDRFFGSIMGMNSVNRTVTAGKRTINVKALPSEGIPDDFSGAVGDFSFNVMATKKDLNASEGFNLEMKVNGNGNLKLFEIPKPEIPPSLEVYDPERSEKIRTSLSGTKGSIIDNYTIIANESGKYPIGPFNFSFFDPKSGSYKTIQSEKIVISVKSNSQSKQFTEESSNNDLLNKSKNLEFSNIKASTSLSPINKPFFFNSKFFWIIFLIPLMIIPCVILITKSSIRKKLDFEGNKAKENKRLSKKFLSDARKNIGNKELFYIALERALHNYLKAKLKIETSELSKEKINILLSNKSIDSSNINSFLSLLETCELARYTPLVSTEMKRDYESASKIISQINKQVI